MTKETTVKEILGNQYDLCARLGAIDQTTLDLSKKPAPYPEDSDNWEWEQEQWDILNNYGE